MLPSADVRCPYCGEWLEILVEDSAGEQRYMEDCQVCCRPIVLVVSHGSDGEPVVVARREDDA